MAASLDVLPAAQLLEADDSTLNGRDGDVTPCLVQPRSVPPSLPFDALRAAMLACARCPKLAASRSRVVPGDGALPASIAFIGLAPGRFGGDRTGIPFDGDRSGELLRRMIKQARLSGVFITNLVRCNPRDDRGRNRDPDVTEIANCRGHLEAELALARPTLVACLGRIAWHALAGRENPFTPCAPAVTKRSGLRLFPLYHPAYVIRGAYPERSYRRDFRRLRAAYARLSAVIPRSSPSQHREITPIDRITADRNPRSSGNHP